jgi:pimeloyl-ACP methyl ester carboxylesterase
VIVLPAAVEPSREPEVREHRHEGFRYESRHRRSNAPRLAPVVLVGGGFQRKESWGRLEEGLLPVADVIATDLPGWGAADTLPAAHGVDMLAGSLERLLEDIGTGPVNLLASSYGSSIAYRLAQARPDLVERMVLVGVMCSVPERHRALYAHLADLMERGDLERFTAIFMDTVMPPRASADVCAARPVRRLLTRLLTSTSADEGAKFITNTRRLLSGQVVDTSAGPTMPTLVATGEHDILTTPGHCRELATTCPQGWYAEIRQSDHMVHLERPDVLVELMTRFYSDDPIEDLPYLRVLEDLRALPVGG